MKQSRPDSRRTLLAAVAFVAGGAVPIQLVTLSFGYAQYLKGVGMGPRVFATAHEFARFYIPFALVPALVILAAIAWYCRKRYPDIYRRITVGFFMGALATVALDAVRQAGVIHGWLPGDTPVMFGKMATGSANFSTLYPVGLFVHYLNGANFGLFYAFVWGKRRSYVTAVIWATVWAQVLELGMMLGPPMGPMVGLFGYNYAWPQLFIITFVAHLAFGITMGVLIQHFLDDDDRAWLVPFVLGRS
ncbi:MAG: hypothetical protein ACE5HT_05495 [Gemmatimonadales bacterium]